jgi:Tfp pilus assembly protein PilF
MSADLKVLQSNRSVREKYLWNRRLGYVRKVAVVTGSLLAIVAISYFVGNRTSRPPEVGWSKDEKAISEYQKGIRAFHQNTADGTAQSATNFESAVSLDPTFARAWARLAYTYISMGYRDRENLEKARPFAEKALALAPKLDDAHRVIAVIYSLLLRDWTRAEEEYNAAIKLNPSAAENFAEYAYFLSNRGRTNEAVQQIKKALRLDSRSYATLQGAAFVYQAARQPDEVIAMINEIIPREPSTARQAALTKRFLLPAYLAKGDYPMAIELEEKSEVLKGNDPHKMEAKYDVLRKAYAEIKEEGYWLQQLQFEFSENGEKRPVRLAAINARLGNSERAIHYLRRALTATPGDLHFELNRDPSFDSLRADLDFQRVQKEQGK